MQDGGVTLASGSIPVGLICLIPLSVQAWCEEELG